MADNIRVAQPIRLQHLHSYTSRILLISDISWYEKCHSRFPSWIFLGTRSVIWDSPIGYFTVRELYSGFPYRMFHKTKGSLMKFPKRGKASCLLKRYSSCDAFFSKFPSNTIDNLDVT